MSNQTTLARTDANVLSLPRAGVETTDEQLREWYIQQRLTLADIAEKLNTSKTSVSRLMDKAGIERRSGTDAVEEHLEEIRSKAYADPDNLRELHYEKGLTLTEISERFEITRGAVAYWFEKHDIEVRSGHYEIPEWTVSAPETFNYAGYPVWKGCDGDTIPVHTLSVIAGGADPYKVFSDGYSTDHLNRHPLDSRPENLELVTTSEHGRREARRNIEYASGFSEADLKYAIRFMLNPSKHLEE